LLQYGIQRSGRDIQARLASHRDRTWLAGMLVLPVAATGSRQLPAIVLKKPDQLSPSRASRVISAAV
jgi:hypothetical protein